MERFYRASGLIVALAALLAMSCDGVLPDDGDEQEPFEVTLALSGTQGALEKEDRFGSQEWVFPLYFSDAPTPATAVSAGHQSGATVIVVTATTNRAFSVTGVRIEQVLYRPEGASSEIGFIHPTTYQPIQPFFLELPGGPVIRIEPPGEDGLPSLFDVDVATVGLPWQDMDADADGDSFLDDQDEEVSVACSLFFEGFLDDGTEFSGSFPAPLRLYFTVQHGTPP
jgi:hypothetical protein